MEEVGSSRGLAGLLIAGGLVVAGGSIVASIVLTWWPGGVACEGVIPVSASELSMIPFGPSCPVDDWALGGVDPAAGGPHLAWTLMIVVGSLAVLAGLVRLVVGRTGRQRRSGASIRPWLLVGAEVGAVVIGLLVVAMVALVVSIVGSAASDGGGPDASAAVATVVVAILVGSLIGAIAGACVGAMGHVVWRRGRRLEPISAGA